MKRYSWKEFDRDSRKLATAIKPFVDSGKIDSIYGIPRGGTVLAVRLSYALNLPLVEKDNIRSTTLVVDDISGTGRTLQSFTGHYTATLLLYKNSKVKPNFWARDAKDFICFPWAPEHPIRGN